MVTINVVNNLSQCGRFAKPDAVICVLYLDSSSLEFVSYSLLTNTRRVENASALHLMPPSSALRPFSSSPFRHPIQHHVADSIPMHPPTIDPSGRWTIEFALDADGLAPTIVWLLGEVEITVRDVGPRQSW